MSRVHTDEWQSFECPVSRPGVGITINEHALLNRFRLYVPVLPLYKEHRLTSNRPGEIRVGGAPSGLLLLSISVLCRIDRN